MTVITPLYATLVKSWAPPEATGGAVMLRCKHYATLSQALEAASTYLGVLAIEDLSTGELVWERPSTEESQP